MKRSEAISHAERFDSGEFNERWRGVSRYPRKPNNERGQALIDYLDTEMRPAFEAMGFDCQTLTDPKARAPFLFAQREGANLPTVFGYGHGDVIRGLEPEWKDGLSPWQLTESNGRWYGRGIADNKGQHSVNMSALRSVIETRGRLGFNAKYLIEMGEETGSLGLRDICSSHKELFKADLLVASDGPRLRPERPTIFGFAWQRELRFDDRSAQRRLRQLGWTDQQPRYSAGARDLQHRVIHRPDSHP